MNAHFVHNDIALIKLTTRVNPNNPLISMAHLATPGANFEGNDCRLTGWGRVGGFGKTLWPVSYNRFTRGIPQSITCNEEVYDRIFG